MCDYSLHGYKNRLATEGETLVIHAFLSGCRGLASPADIAAARLPWYTRVIDWFAMCDPGWRTAEKIPAVCVPPGARLRLVGVPKATRDMFGLREVEDVTLTHLTLEPFRYRDGLRFTHRVSLPYGGRFGDRYTLSLQNLEPGIRVEVVRLELEEIAVEEKASVSYA